MGLTQASKSLRCKKAFSFSEYSVLRIQNIALEAFFDKSFLANEKEPEGLNIIPKYLYSDTSSRE
jgi:hypothetical protein